MALGKKFLKSRRMHLCVKASLQQLLIKYLKGTMRIFLHNNIYWRRHWINLQQGRWKVRLPPWKNVLVIMTLHHRGNLSSQKKERTKNKSKNSGKCNIFYWSKTWKKKTSVRFSGEQYTQTWMVTLFITD